MFGGGNIIDLYELNGNDDDNKNTDNAIIKWVEWNKTNYSMQKGIFMPQDSKLRLDQVELTVSDWSTQRLFEKFVGMYRKSDKFAIMYVYDAYNQANNVSSTAQANFDEAKALAMKHTDFYKDGKLEPEVFAVGTNIGAALGTEIQVADKPVMNIYNYIPTAKDHVLDMRVKTNGAGNLSKAIVAGHFNSVAFNTIVIEGLVNEDDVHQVNIMTNGPKRLDLRAVTVTSNWWEGDENELWYQGLSNLNNNNLEYIVLPDNMTKEQVQASTFAGLINLGNSGNFKSAISAQTTTSNETTTSTGVVGYVNEAGTFNTAMAFSFGSNRWVEETNHVAQGITSLTLAGNLNATDISANATEGAMKDEVGTITSLDLENAVFATQTDMNFNAAGYQYLTNVKLPVSHLMTTIPTSCFENIKTLTSICVPGNYKVFEARCFYDDFPLSHVYTTEVDAEGNGNYAAPVDHGANTLTLPAGLTSIATQAFGLDEKFTDVYVISATVPTCASGAFGDGTSGGWGGFNAPSGNTNTATMANYQNTTVYTNSNFKTFSILHWPAGISDEDKAKYTDLTRTYSYSDANGKLAADGTPYKWPTHEEFTDAYSKATSGYLKDGTTTYDKANYGGWHEFVLTDGTAQSFALPTVKENDWYTICLPFDLTKSELLKYFGNEANATYPELVTLAQVNRDKENNQITLKMTKDLVANNSTWNFEAFANGDDIISLSLNPASNYVGATESDPVILKAGQPYFILPQLPKEVLDAGVAGVTRHIEKNSTVETPNTSYAIAATYTNSNNEIVALDKDDVLSTAEGYKASTPYLYHFVGTFTSSTIPQNAYYLGRVKSTGAHNLFVHTATGTKTWSAYGCLIGHVEASLTDNMSYLITNTLNDAFKDNNDNFVSANFAVSFDDENDATSIKGLTPTLSEGEGAVFDLQGRRVNGQWSTVNGKLPRGVYIINGRKVIIK